MCPSSKCSCVELPIPQGLGLSGTIPPRVRECTDLVVIDFSSQNLVGAIPVLPLSLKRLYLVNNKVERLDGLLAQPYPVLTQLWLGQNNFSGTLVGFSRGSLFGASC